MPFLAPFLAAVFGVVGLLATTVRCTGLADERRLALALGFFTALRADFAALVVFFLFAAVALEVRPAALVLALLMPGTITANFVLV